MSKSVFKEEAENMERMAKAFDKYGPDAHNDLVHFLFNEARYKTPEVTGNLRRNWSILIRRKTGAKITGGVYNPTEYGPHVEYGHRVKIPIKRNGKTIGYRYAGYVEGKYFFDKAKRAYRKARGDRLKQLQDDMAREGGFK